MEKCLKNEYSFVSAQEAKSAQQRVIIIEVDRKAESTVDTTSVIDEKWSDCLKKGKNRLAVRIWKGGSNWWNLNRNQDPVEIARQEIRGYQIARQAFQEHQSSNITIPRVLHYQLNDQNTSSSSGRHCWAVLEYVGLHSTSFDENHRLPVSSYLDGMVKVRHEFGFDEPHPRWGRVPVEECLDYATMILKEVVLPLQRFYTKRIVTTHDVDDNDTKPQNYATMVQKYHNTFQELWSSSQNDAAMQTDERMMRALETVKEAVTRILPQHLSNIPPMSPVLVHLDLQPQNLLFYKTATTQNNNNNNNKEEEESNSTLHVSSILDWEDASFADPRLELLLMCRKVCANRSQAKALWSLFRTESLSSLSSLVVDPGPMEPWLQLECIHSILTLLLQSMDLLNGGRNPWESKRDLRGKLQRELYRWNALNLNV
ncbi:unnamed protein product [Cylindrotheca closterium]|uniref:Aminoglycoside phosphotransferase domain-containing protein n=1 Tax=Cylindrotheca closterium TaxID=2856 RepID=A0AAD2CMR0_9STRA|nr:unnamed protein product [Cylindrotheca closterium]